jgi:hypothetical protein
MLQTEITQDAIVKAERIMRQIDARHATLNNRDCESVALVPENFDPSAELTYSQ